MAIIDSVKLPDNSTYDVADNYSGYAKKVAGATTDDLASLTATGDLADSGKKLSDLVLKSDVKDVLNSTSVTDPLSANQGRVLAENLAANENVYGAKNLVSPDFVDGTKTLQNVSFVDNGNGTITISGTAQADIYYWVKNQSKGVPLKKGTYILNGCPVGGSPTGYNLYVADSNGNTIGVDVGNGAEFTLNNDDIVNLLIYCANSTAISSPITFKPMLRDARILDDTFVPYVPTNRELMSYKANGRVGAKNFNAYPYSDTTKTESGVAFTDNDNGTITLNNTATADVWFNIHSNFGLYLENGSYKMNGTPAGAGSSCYWYIHYKDTNNNDIFVNDTGDGNEFTIQGSYGDANGANVSVYLVALNGKSFSNVTIKPMIRIAEDTDPNYQPYAMTNRQLTERINNDFLIKSFNIPSGSIQSGAYAEVVSAQDIAVAGYELTSVCYYALGSYSGTLICQFLIQGNNPRIELFNAGANASDPEGIVKCTYKKTT